MKYAAALLGVALAMTSACRSHIAQLPRYGEVPRFLLTAQDGRTFDSGVLRGNIWVADFIFTACGAACPRMTSRMREVQQATRNMPSVRLVSFTVDPARDTAQRLSLYAKAHHADPQRWYFLTGRRSDLDYLGFDVFKLNHVDETLQHSTRFVLVDKDSRIRGYYDTNAPDAISKLLADIHALGA